MCQVSKGDRRPLNLRGIDVLALVAPPDSGDAKDSRIVLASTGDNHIGAPPGYAELYAPVAVNGGDVRAGPGPRVPGRAGSPRAARRAGPLHHYLTREAPAAPFFAWGGARKELEALRGGERAPTERVLGLWRKHSAEAAAQRADRKKWERERGERRCGGCDAGTPGKKQRFKGVGPWLCCMCYHNRKSESME
jgi:hypothetical protein